jgi:hypothetical protein
METGESRAPDGERDDGASAMARVSFVTVEQTLTGLSVPADLFLQTFLPQTVT